MEIQNVLEEYWYGLHCELWNISQLNAGDFVTRAQAVVGSGTEEQIVAMLRQSINEYQGERSIMKYIYILDKLLKIPEFCLALQESLPELYTSVFVSLLLQKCGKEMQELKVLRKYWVACLHPSILKMIRDTVFNKTGIDIDTGIKPEIVAMIKEFYVNKLKLTPNEVEYHLPQKKTSSEPRTGIDQVIRAQPASLVLTNHGIALGAHPVANIASQNFPYQTQLARQIIPNQFPMMQNPQQVLANHQPRMIAQPMKLMQKMVSSADNQPNLMPINQQHLQVQAQMRSRQYLQTQMILIERARLEQQRYRSSHFSNTGFTVQENYYERQNNAYHYPDNYQADRYQSDRYASPEGYPSHDHYQGADYYPYQYPDADYYPGTDQQDSAPYDQEHNQPSGNSLSNSNHNSYSHSSQYSPVQQEEQEIPKRQLQGNRKRFLSQQTKLPFVSDDNQVSELCRPRKVVHLSVLDYGSMLRALRELNSWQCRQCGISHSTLSKHEMHVSEHLREKLARLDRNPKRSRRGLLMDEVQWAGTQQQVCLDQFCIQLPVMSYDQYHCHLCKEHFETVFRKDKWMLTNASRVSVAAREVYMHKTCQETLELQ